MEDQSTDREGGGVRFRYSIRDIGWLTLVVVILIMWWLDHRNLVARNRFTVETVRRSDGEPVVLRDNQQQDVILIRDKDGQGWKVAVPYGKSMPSFKPE